MRSADDGELLLILGASGQVGYHLSGAAERHGLDWLGTFHATAREGLLPLDVRNGAAVMGLMRRVRPTTVLMPASATNVDRCEQMPEEAYAVNVVGLLNVIAAANAVGATLAFFSSDYVFDGADGPYDESAPANPICRYGAQKLIAEHLVLSQADDALIIRTTVVYGWEPQGKNFVFRLLSAVSAGTPIEVPRDQIGSPTYAPTLAEAALELLATGARGIVNVAGRELVARDEFAREAVRVFGGDAGLITPVSTAELGQPAPRPLSAGLRVELAERRLGWELVGYTGGLRRMHAERPSQEDIGHA